MQRLGTRPALDGVRALAIVAVMLLHADDRIAPGGFLGVDVFFVLSAFLISSLIMDEVTATREASFDFAAFYLRRAFRLAPALLLFLATLAPLTAAEGHEAGRIPLSTLWSLLYVGNYAVTYSHSVGDAYQHVWSLAIEEQFYLVWPFVLVTLSRRPSLRRPMLMFGFGASFVVFVVVQHISPDHNYYLPSGHIMPIMAGCLLADLFAFGSPAWLERTLRSGLIGDAAVAVLVALVVGYRHVHGDAQIYGASILAALVGAVIVGHATYGSAMLSHPIVRWIGQRSYGLYLYHRTIAILMPFLIKGLTLRTAGPLDIVIALVLAELSFRYIERPVRLRGREWLVSRRHASDTGSPATPV